MTKVMYIIIGLLCVGGGFAALPAFAFTLSPLKYMTTVDPGGASIARVTVYNDDIGARRVIFRTIAVQQGVNGVPQFIPGGDSAEAWVVPETTEVVLRSGERKTVAFLISVPATAIPNAHYLALTARANTATTTATVGITGQLATLLTLQVAGTAREELKIIQLEKKTSVVAPMAKWRTLVSNVGNIEVPATAALIIKDWGGKEKLRAPVILQNTIIAGAERVVEAKANLQTLLPGRYSAELQITYGRSNAQIKKEIFFWYIPVWSLLSAVIGAVIIGGWFVRMRK